MSRNAENARALAEELSAPPAAPRIAAAAATTSAAPLSYTDSLESLRRDADVYILASSDQAINEAARTLRLGDALVVHTAGAISLKTLEPVSSRYGVLYPLQSIRKEVTYPVGIPLLIDGNTSEVQDQIRSLALSISDMVRHATDTQRQRLHVGAVVVNNFPNYLYTLTETYLKEEGMDFKWLQPLLAETVRRLDTFSPGEVQTGPAYRGDTATLALHRSLLETYPELRGWYELFTEKITEMYRKGGA